MLKQAQKMQADMAEMQQRLLDSTVAGQSGGGMVQATVNGKGEVKALKIDPGLLTPEDAEMLEDLIIAALNDARRKADAMMAEEMSKLTGGLSLPPGFTLPFA